MKLISFLKALLVGILMLSISGCQQSDPGEGNLTNTGVSILLDVDKLTLESANIRVRHTGDADMAWVYVVTPDLDTPAEELIEEKIESELGFTDEVLAYKGTNKSILVPQLEPKSYYRFICQAIDEQTAKVVGVPSELTFRTRRDPSVFELNENWTITVGERFVNNMDNQEYDTFILNSDDEESYVLVSLKVEDYATYYKSDMQSFFEDYVASYGYDVGDRKWEDIVKTGDMTWSEQRLRSGDWLVFMIGLDSDGELTGYYQKLAHTIVPEVATEEYNRWLGKWEVISNDGIKMFEIDVLPSENNMWYYLSGWESENVFQFDTKDQTLMAELFFDKETGEMCFISQFLNTLVDTSGTYEFYFSGTFTYGKTYVLAPEVLNYRMADAWFMDSTYTTAMVEGNNFVSDYGVFPVEKICIMYTYGDQIAAISLAQPALPLTLKKVQ